MIEVTFVWKINKIEIKLNKIGWNSSFFEFFVSIGMTEGTIILDIKNDMKIVFCQLFSLYHVA